MKHQAGFLKGVRDSDIYYQSWLPEGETRAVLLVVHGIAEHSGRYMNVVNHFGQLGYAVYGLDHPGHGKSNGPRVYVERFQDFTATLKLYFDQVRRWQPEKAIFLVGHSMGGLISAVYLLDYQAELAGAILSGPSVQLPDNVSPALILTGKVFSTLIPRAGLVQLDAAGVSRDPAVVQAYLSDPLVYQGKITARLSAELLKAMQRIEAESAKITLPLLIIHGGADKMVNPIGSQKLYEEVGSVDKTLKIYPGFYHEVFNDPAHQQVLGDVETWLEGQLGRNVGLRLSPE